jgi:hypothetical protein
MRHRPDHGPAHGARIAAHPAGSPVPLQAARRGGWRERPGPSPSKGAQTAAAEAPLTAAPLRARRLLTPALLGAG